MQNTQGDIRWGPRAVLDMCYERESKEDKGHLEIRGTCCAGDKDRA